MNIGKTLESLNSLVNKKQRKRITRHSNFMKQQKRTLLKTLKQDKMYRQQLHNFQEDMFNSTITRIKKKTKKGNFDDVKNNTVIGGDDSFQSLPDSSPNTESTNITIIISKVVIDRPNQPESEPKRDVHNGNSLEVVDERPESSKESNESNRMGEDGNNY